MRTVSVPNDKGRSSMSKASGALRLPQHTCLRSRRITLAALAVAALAVTAGSAGTIAAAATQTKFFKTTYTVNTTNGELLVDTPATVGFTITNSSSSTQPFGSAEVTLSNLPASALSNIKAGTQGWTASSLTSSPATILVENTSGTAIAPGGSLTFSAEVTAPAAGSVSISTVVKQSNNFNGSGNDFIDLNGSTDGTIQVEPVTLVFTAQPNTALQQSANGTYYAFCPPVAVEAYYSSTSGSSVPVDGVAVTLSYDPADGNPGLYWTGSGATKGASSVTMTTGSTGSTGVAVFGSGSAPSACTGFAATALGAGYQLLATSPAAGTAGVASNSFAVVTDLTTCANSSTCTSSTITSKANGTQGQATMSCGSSSGCTLATSFGLDQALSCDSAITSSGATPDEYYVDSAQAGPGSVTLTFTKKFVDQIPNNGTPLLPVCASAGSDFIGYSATPGSPTTSTEGLLYSCTDPTYEQLLQSAGAPSLTLCVSSYSKSGFQGGEQVVIESNELGDPMHMI